MDHRDEICQETFEQPRIRSSFGSCAAVLLRRRLLREELEPQKVAG